jgi:hypothetical protein
MDVQTVDNQLGWFQVCDETKLGIQVGSRELICSPAVQGPTKK